MNKKHENLRWLISLMLLVFWSYGVAQVSEPRHGTFAGDEIILSNTVDLFTETFEDDSPSRDDWT